MRDRTLLRVRTRFSMRVWRIHKPIFIMGVTNGKELAIQKTRTRYVRMKPIKKMRNCIICPYSLISPSEATEFWITMSYSQDESVELVFCRKLCALRLLWTDERWDSRNGCRYSFQPLHKIEVTSVPRSGRRNCDHQRQAVPHTVV